MTIKTDSWHYKWYAYWLEHIGNTPGYMENLCHYVRVLVFWATLLWVGEQLLRWERFWSRLGKVLGYTLAALFIAAGLGGLVFLLALLGYVLWTEPLKSLIVIGLAVGIIAGALVAIVTVMFSFAMLGEALRDRKPPTMPGTLKLAGAYVVAKKRRICPFIEFEEQEARV